MNLPFRILLAPVAASLMVFTIMAAIMTLGMGVPDQLSDTAERLFGKVFYW